MKTWKKGKIDGPFTWKECVGALLYVLAGFLLSVLTSLILTFFQLQSNDETIKGMLYQQNVWTLIVLIFLSPVIEEVIFRYIIFKVVLRNTLKLPLWVAAGISSLLFGMMHQPLEAALLATGFGLILCSVYEKTEKLRYSICIHFGFNLFSFCILLLSLHGLY